jgi:hypothetical protein
MMAVITLTGIYQENYMNTILIVEDDQVNTKVFLKF